MRTTSINAVSPSGFGESGSTPAANSSRITGSEPIKAASDIGVTPNTFSAAALGPRSDQALDERRHRHSGPPTSEAWCRANRPRSHPHPSSMSRTASWSIARTNGVDERVRRGTAAGSSRAAPLPTRRDFFIATPLPNRPCCCRPIRPERPLARAASTGNCCRACLPRTRGADFP